MISDVPWGQREGLPTLHPSLDGLRYGCRHTAQVEVEGARVRLVVAAVHVFNFQPRSAAVHVSLKAVLDHVAALTCVTTGGHNSRTRFTIA